MADRVLVAPDKFKGSLAATEVAARVAAGLARAGFRGEVVQLPVADGGDGTVDAAVSAGYRRVELEVRGTVLGLNVTSASFGWLGAASLGGWMMTQFGFAGFGPLAAGVGLVGAALALVRGR